MRKKVMTSTAARNALVAGIDQLANTIKATLGPKGRNVVIANEYIGPYITNDGATIAREFMVEDPFENVGIELVKEVALKTNDLAGDGTTTATLLAQKMIHDGLSYIDKGYSPMLLKEGMQKATIQALQKLGELSIPISTTDQIRNVASISSGDLEIGEMIADAMEQIGSDGLLSIEETQGMETVLEISTGYRIDAGYLSPYMITDQSKMCSELENPYILITNQKITDIHQIAPILEELISMQASLVIVSDSIMEDVLSTLVLNKMQNILNVVAIQAPSTHEKRKEILMDLAIVTGGKMSDETLGLPLEKITLFDLGRAAKVSVHKDRTIFVKGDANQKELTQRKQQVQLLLKETSSDFEKNQLRERLSRLSEAAAIIKVGAISELEKKEKKMKIEDALCATNVAHKEGILIGSGMSYLQTAKYLDSLTHSETKEDILGIKIISNALKEPVKQLLDNAGISSQGAIYDKIQTLSGYEGYDIKQSKFVNLLEAGIVDPTTVEKIALQSAASIASLLLTTESVLVDVSSESILKKDFNEQLVSNSAAGLF